MSKIILTFCLLFSLLCKANENVAINHLYSKYIGDKNNSLVIYGVMNNISNQLDYLLGLEVVGHPEIEVTINKTVIEQNVARIIKIDRLAIPAESSVSLTPLGIYLVTTKFPEELLKVGKIKIKFIFSQYAIIKEILLN